MKKILLLLSALIFSAAAWAADTADATNAANPSVPVAAEQAAQTASPAAESFQLATGAATCPVACRLQRCPPPIGPTKMCCPMAPYTQTCP